MTEWIQAVSSTLPPPPGSILSYNTEFYGKGGYHREIRKNVIEVTID
jgi:hypothetical protein